jgi:hypothetical protein
VHFLKTSGIHLFADDALDIAIRDETQGQPREDAWCDATHVTTAHEESVTRHLSISRILTQGAKEEVRQTQ